MARAMAAAQSVLRGHGGAETEEVLHRLVGDDALRLAAGAAEVELGDALEVQHHADRADDLAERRRVAQRPEDEEVGHQPDQRGHRQGHAERPSRCPTPRRRRA